MHVTSMKLVRVLRQIATLLTLLGCSLSLSASHWMGGEITWECLGNGDYAFELKIYRDCNGVAGPTNAQLAVWNHPNINAIPLNLISQTDISPTCTVVPGGPQAITCGAGGAGAVEEFVFQSAAFNIPGTPPAAGWVFTWDSFSRNAAINNLQNPDSYGITLRAVMYAFNGQNSSPCFDSSPKFAERPATVLCTGSPFSYNHNAADPDFDSLVFSFGAPLDDLNGQFNPGVDPIFVPFETNYSVNSPLPGPAINSSNSPVTINSATGEISFTSFTQGNFVLVVKVESWRDGQLLSEVYREIQTVLLACGAQNTAPQVNAPFPGGLYADTVTAGDLVNFTFSSTDLELLQDGSPQSNIFEPSGIQFGTNFTDPNSGCPNPPCAVVSNPIPLVGSQGINTDFTWQTDCSHVGGGSNSTTYNFVFKVADDFCPAPGISLPTISITVRAPASVPAPTVHCASVLANGDVELTWTPAIDPLNSFVNYEVWSSTSQAGPFALVGTVGNINTATYVHPGADAQNGSRYYFVKSISGCGGAQAVHSDTLQTMFLQLTSLVGVADLSWNAMHTPNLPSANAYYHVYVEYPLGTWLLLDSVPYGNEQYAYVVDICGEFLNFKVELTDTAGCTSVSSVVGDFFQDVTSPEIPIMEYVTVDTATGMVVVHWQQNPSDDTQGYIIMHFVSGNWLPYDTVWGIGNTVFTDTFANSGTGSIDYGVVAFDSCWTGTPPGPNTSALGNTHYTVFLETALDICEREVTLTWNNYPNVNGNVDYYEIYAIQGATTMFLGTTSNGDTTFVHSDALANEVYCYVIKTIFSGASYTSLSNKACRLIYQPASPTVNYLQSASVLTDTEIQVRVHTDLAAAVTEYVLLRADDAMGPFEPVAQEAPVVANPLVFYDPEVETTLQSYHYQIGVIDSCGDTSAMWSNVAKTILLQAYADNDALKNVIYWSAYEGWAGSVIEYRLYRAIDGVLNPVPIAILPPNLRAFEDDVESYLTESSGNFCYYVEAVESNNSFGLSETAFSNTGCAFQEPKFWIPSAFMVNSDIPENQIFRPIAGYVDVNNYKFYVYNRWGQVIFETDQIEDGWDGTFKGQLSPEGVYVYHFVFENSEGSEVDRRGSITLLHGGR